jgi:hypothetical protein
MKIIARFTFKTLDTTSFIAIAANIRLISQRMYPRAAKDITMP